MPGAPGFVPDPDSGPRLDLDLALGPTGDPGCALAVLPLDEWAHRPAEWIAGAAVAVRGALPVTVGVLRRPVDMRLAPLLEAATLTLAAGATKEANRQLICMPDVDEGLASLRAAVSRAPRAAVACGQLLRQTERLNTDTGLAAEAALYSTLLGGPEFTRWLSARGGVSAPKPPDVVDASDSPDMPAAPRAPLVLLDRTADHLSITLSNPRRRNAFSFAMREELLGALKLAELDRTIEEVYIGGAGPAFCSGGDLAEFGTATDPTAAYLVRLARAPWRIVDRLADRVTVRAHGACIGAGTELAAFAGRVIAAPDAFFALPEVGMGLVPGAGGTVSVPRRIGRWRAAWLMLTGQRLDAATALRWGLVDACE